MAGRGCTITVKLLGNGNSSDNPEEMSLPVALHSPLEVLKGQLSEITGIPPADQVLILCDLSDPDRNSDILLAGRDHMSLVQCGIRNGSVLTLHPLGMSAEQKQKMLKEAFSEKKMEVYDRPVYSLDTYIKPADADHSYNGIIFDVESNGPFEVDLLSVSIAGMLGRIRIFARDRPWRTSAPRTNTPDRWWAYREGLGREGWTLIADTTCRPSWDKPIEIKFNRPVKLQPYQKRALYCHSSLPDDLGIQYQSFDSSDVVGEDEYLVIRPGLGHTGNEPFDDRNGWYRSYRGLAGGLKYHAKWKAWNMNEHLLFPSPLRRAVFTLLLCETRSHRDPNISLTPSNSPMVTHHKGLHSSKPPGKYHISSLPRYVIIHILEFMHFDWFKELEIEQEETPPSDRKKGTLSKNFFRMLGNATTNNHILNFLNYLQQMDGHGGGLTATLGNGDEDEEYQYEEDEEEDDDDEDYVEEEDDNEEDDEDDDDGFHDAVEMEVDQGMNATYEDFDDDMEEDEEEDDDDEEDYGDTIHLEDIIEESSEGNREQDSDDASHSDD